MKRPQPALPKKVEIAYVCFPTRIASPRCGYEGASAAGKAAGATAGPRDHRTDGHDCADSILASLQGVLATGALRDGDVFPGVLQVAYATGRPACFRAERPNRSPVKEAL